MFTAQEILVANKTSRTNGASARNRDGSVRAIVPRYILENVNKNDSILDYGSGKDAVHTLWLREKGFTNVTAYDFGHNIKKGIHDSNALDRQYKTIFASNVLNVQSSLQMLTETLLQIYNATEVGGEFVCNYTSSPRKMNMKPTELKSIIEQLFSNSVELVGGNNSAPVWKAKKVRIVA